MSERETVKEEVARLREHLKDLEWLASDCTFPPPELSDEYAAANRRIDYLTREYIARGIEYEPEH